MALTIIKDAGAGSSYDTTLTINNMANITTRYVVPADEIPDIGGTEEDQLLLKFFSPTLKISVDWLLGTETSSVVSGMGGTVDSAVEQYLYLSNIFLSKGSTGQEGDNITDEFTLIITFNSTAVNSGTASSGTVSTLVDTGIGWTANAYSGKMLKLTGGTGSGQYRAILSNTTDTATVDRDWDTNPDGTTTYQILDAMAKTGQVTDLTMTITDTEPVTVRAHLEFTVGQSI